MDKLLMDFLGISDKNTTKKPRKKEVKKSKSKKKLKELDKRSLGVS